MDLITAALGVLASCSVVHKKAKACKKSTFLEFFFILLRWSVKVVQDFYPCLNTMY